MSKARNPASNGTHHRMFTIFGWSPGLRLLVSSDVLECGCSVGRYETWDKRIVTVLDAASPSCANDAHVINCVIDAPRVAPATQPF